MTAKQTRLHALHRQIDRLDERLAALAHLSNRLAWVRLGVFGGGAAATIAAFAALGMVPGLIVLAVWLGVFNTAAHYHARLKTGIARGTVWRAIKQEHCARMALDWDHLPPAIKTPASPLALDLDLTGERSLHRLLDTSVSREGSLRLLDWMTADVPDPERIQARQALVAELIPLVTFRDKLRLSATLSESGPLRRWHGDRLRAWLAALPPVRSLRGIALLLTALAAVDAVLLVLNQLGIIPPYWGFSFMLYVGLGLWAVQQLGDPFELALKLGDPLTELRGVFTHLETYRYGSNAHLRALCTPFVASERCPSREIRRLTRVVSAASLRGNPLLWTLVSALVPWDVYVAILVNRRRRAIAELLPQWLDVWFELEALAALANLAYLNPDYTFPTLAAPQPDQPVFEARDLGHPLIPDDVRVCNTFTLDQLGTLALITGSNMSGKSTFLRTLGVNLCLAYAGGPVNARRLRTVPFRLFTCIRVTDSVTDGISYFYAEVQRLKALLSALEADHAYPLFFLIDEIFRGTNNRERLIGSRAYIRALVAKHGAGAISTHDLELVKLADDIPAIRNYHFTETVGEGRLLFDYTLRPGPCPTTNALAIMRMEGLPVD